MPRVTTPIPKYGLHKPTGQARVVIGGHSHYLGKYGSEQSWQRYEQLISGWIANHQTLPAAVGNASQFTINELLLAYLRFAERYYVKHGKPTSEYSCLKMAINPLQDLYGKTFVADFGPLDFKAVRQRMIELGWCRGVINRHAGRLKRIFRWGVENELIHGSVNHALEAVTGLRKGRSAARETDPVKPVPDQHVDAIKPFVSSTVWAMIELQRLTGMRPGEVRAMRGCDLDTSGALWEYRPASHKTEHHEHVRVIPLGPRAQAITRPFLKPDLTAFLFNPRDAEAARNADRRRNRKTPMTPSQRQRKPKSRWLCDHYTKDTYSRATRRACRHAGVPPWHPNQLRHSSGTWVRKQMGLEAAQVWLGHSSADVTQVYAERNLQLAREIAAKFG